MQIGFFDSGIGGITVLHEAVKQMPCENFIYYADTDNTPYGTKPKNEVREYIMNAVEFIVSKGVDAVVVACNTATSIAIEDLRKKYDIPILGMEPAVKPAIEMNHRKNKRVLVTATPLTLKEEKLKNLIEKVGNEELVDLLPLPGLVEFAERFQFEGEAVDAYIKQEFSKYHLEDYGTVVLGCTHFPFYKKSIAKILSPQTDIIDGNEGTIRNLKRIMGNCTSDCEPDGEIIYYHSGRLVMEQEGLLKFARLFNVLDLNV